MLLLSQEPMENGCSAGTGTEIHGKSRAATGKREKIFWTQPGENYMKKQAKEAESPINSAFADALKNLKL